MHAPPKREPSESRTLRGGGFQRDVAPPPPDARPPGPPPQNGKRRHADPVIQEVRDTMIGLRRDLFSLIEATGMVDPQLSGTRGLIRTLTYDAQADLEAILRGRQ